MPRVLSTLFFLAGLLGPGAPHPDSLSRSRLVVSGASALLEMRFQSLSVLELEPALDLDRDGELSAAECQLGEAWILGYVASHWRLLGPTDEPLATPRLLSIGPSRGMAAQPGLDGTLVSSMGLGWLEARFEFQSPQPWADFCIESRLFYEESPTHRDMASVVFNGEREFFLPFQAGPFRHEFSSEAGRRPGVLVSYMILGFEHIRSGYDHLAFLLVLIVAVPRLRSLLGLVTAFTLAHSISLAAMVLSAGGWLGSLNGPLVEMGIALSIAYVATDNLIRRAGRNAWPEAFLFGLLHGLGFAGFLRPALEGEPLLISALLGFNLGVEGGQLLVVLVAALLLCGCRRWLGRAAEPPVPNSQAAEQPPASFAPPMVRNLVSLGVALLGFYWFFERSGWFA